jgi:3-deoxy-D-manno-octulosonic-acid transferase
MTTHSAPPEPRVIPHSAPPSAKASAPLAESALRLTWHVLAGAALLAAPAVLAWDLVNGRGGAPLRERLGLVPRSQVPPLWIHAASVGEVSAALPLLAALRAALPPMPIVLSTMTATGRASAGRAANSLTMPPFHVPADAAPCVSLALSRLRPAAFLSIETELWPNLFRALARRGVPAAVVNGRLSPRHLPRYASVRPLVASVLRDASLLAMRTPEDAERALMLGAPAERVIVTGNLKFDAALAVRDQPDLPWVGAAGLLRGPWIAFASTAAGEEGVLLDAFAKLASERPDLRCLLAPKRPDRRDEVAALIAARRLPFVVRSAAGDSREVPPGAVLLLDTVGELARLYRHASIVFVGGSLVPHGGQNLLEPASAARPVLFGPHVENFRDAEEALLASGGGLRVTRETLVDAARTLLGDPAARDAVGAAALAAVRRHEGATRRTVDALMPLLVGSGRPA